MWNLANMFMQILPSTDQILHHEMDAVSYRVLGYLLSGVVKIYSKKVEYLLDDCNKVLLGINKFVIKAKNNTPVEKLRMTFIIPDTFELDAINLVIRNYCVKQRSFEILDLMHILLCM